MIFVETKRLGQGWSLQIKHGKRTTYALYLHSGKVKTFWQKQDAFTFLKDLGVELNTEGVN